MARYVLFLLLLLLQLYPVTAELLFFVVDRPYRIVSLSLSSLSSSSLSSLSSSSSLPSLSLLLFVYNIMCCNQLCGIEQTHRIHCIALMTSNCYHLVPPHLHHPSCHLSLLLIIIIIVMYCIRLSLVSFFSITTTTFLLTSLLKNSRV